MFGDVGDQFSPQKINTPYDNFKIKSIQAGVDFALVLTEDEKVYSIGRNSYGNLGDGTSNFRKSLYLIREATNVTFIATGYDHSTFIKFGRMYSFGRNDVR